MKRDDFLRLLTKATEEAAEEAGNPNPEMMVVWDGIGHLFDAVSVQSVGDRAIQIRFLKDVGRED